MTTTENKPIQWKTPDSITPPGMDPLARSFTAMLAKTQVPTPEERKLGEQVRVDLAKQIGTAIKIKHAQYLASALSIDTVNHMDEYITKEREIRDRERLPQDQADMEAFCHMAREATGNSFLALRQAGVNQLETIAMTPLEILDEQADEVIITQEPNLLQRLLGAGPQITQVKR